MGKYLEIYNLLKWTQVEKENWISQITTKEIAN